MWSGALQLQKSRPELKKFPREAPFILVKAARKNGRYLDVGDGWAIAFKIESHQSPERCGAISGCGDGGGRDHPRYFHDGARPILNMNSLRFWSYRGRFVGGGAEPAAVSRAS